MQTLAQTSFDTRGRYRLALQIETLIVEMRARCSDLEQEVRTAERLYKHHDPDDVAYPPLALALRARAQNLRRSIAELETELHALSVETPTAECPKEILASEDASPFRGRTPELFKDAR